jgi:hypothetical protein
MPTQARLRVPVDQGRLLIMATGAKERTRRNDAGDWETRVDPDTGEKLFQVHTVAMFLGAPEGQLWTIGVVGDPGALPPGAQIRCVNLEASPWEIRGDEGRFVSGLSFKADRIEVLAVPGQPAAPFKAPVAAGDGQKTAGKP